MAVCSQFVCTDLCFSAWLYWSYCAVRSSKTNIPICFSSHRHGAQAEYVSLLCCYEGRSFIEPNEIGGVDGTVIQWMCLWDCCNFDLIWYHKKTNQPKASQTYLRRFLKEAIDASYWLLYSRSTQEPPRIFSGGLGKEIIGEYESNLSPPVRTGSRWIWTKLAISWFGLDSLFFSTIVAKLSTKSRWIYNKWEPRFHTCWNNREKSLKIFCFSFFFTDSSRKLGSENYVSIEMINPRSAFYTLSSNHHHLPVLPLLSSPSSDALLCTLHCNA